MIYIKIIFASISFLLFYIDGIMAVTIPFSGPGELIAPNEGPLKGWQVYTKKNTFSAKECTSLKINDISAETTVLSFFGLIHRKDLRYYDLLVKNVSSELKNELARNVTKNHQRFKEVHLLARISYVQLAYLATNTKKPFWDKKALGAIEKFFGKYDVVVFVESPTSRYDTFFFLRYTTNGYRIAGVIGSLLFSPKPSKK